MDKDLEMAHKLIQLERVFSSDPVDIDEVIGWKSSRLWQYLEYTLLLKRPKCLELSLAVDEPGPLKGQVVEIDSTLKILAILELQLSEVIKREIIEKEERNRNNG